MVKPIWPQDMSRNPDTLVCCWPSCAKPVDMMALPICTNHGIKVAVEFMREARGVISVESGEPAAESLARRRQAQYAAQSQVYYVRIGDHIKIGVTINLIQRLSSLRIDADAVLATEPGDGNLELQRHREFAEERIGRRENFNPSRRLLDHIEQVKAAHGEPKITGYIRVA